MADVSPDTERRRRRLLAVAALLGLLGFLGGAATNRALAHFLALPEDSELPVYADAAAPSPSADGQSEAVAPALSGIDLDLRPRGLSRKQYAETIVRRNIFDSTAVYDPNATQATGDGSCRTD